MIKVQLRYPLATILLQYFQPACSHCVFILIQGWNSSNPWLSRSHKDLWSLGYQIKYNSLKHYYITWNHVIIINELLIWTIQRSNVFHLMKKDAGEVSSRRMEVHTSLSHQRNQLDHKNETEARNSSPPESSELLHLEHLENLNFTYKSNH